MTGKTSRVNKYYYIDTYEVSVRKINIILSIYYSPKISTVSITQNREYNGLKTTRLNVMDFSADLFVFHYILLVWRNVTFNLLFIIDVSEYTFWFHSCVYICDHNNAHGLIGVYISTNNGAENHKFVQENNTLRHSSCGHKNNNAAINSPCYRFVHFVRLNEWWAHNTAVHRTFSCGTVHKTRWSMEWWRFNVEIGLENLKRHHLFEGRWQLSVIILSWFYTIFDLNRIQLQLNVQ